MDVVRSGVRLNTLGGLSAGEERALTALARGGATEDDLADLAGGEDGSADLAPWYFRLARLEALGVLRHSLVQGGETILQVDVVTRGGRVTATPVGDHALLLSRFVTARRDGAALVLESPRSGARITLVDPGAATLIQLLAEARTPRQVAEALPAWTEATVRAVLGLLQGAGFLTGVGDDGTPEEDAGAAARLWEAQDLAFHAHARLGHHDRPVGGTLPFQGVVPPLPALRPPRGTPTTALPAPDPAGLEASDPSLFRAMEARRSGRPPFSRSVGLDELSTLLWRTARVDAGRPRGGSSYPVLARPHPSGGATYPLEWYVVQRSCAGLDPGIHHYLPDRHALEEVPLEPGALDAVLGSYAAALGGGEGVPPVLLVLTARFGRVSWKYRSVAYALILKEVGVVQQNLYLVATALGLEACALGAGDDVLFGRAVGLDPLEEAAVGELMLGANGPGGAQPAS